MQRKIKAGAVSYLNTKPLIYGIENGMMAEELDLIIDYPSKIAEQLLEGEIDLGLVPVAILPQMKEFHIVSDYCIGCEGDVASVCLFSEVPLSEIKTVLLDYQSRTSVALLKILMKDFWKMEVQFENTTGNYQEKIKGNVAGLVIGDRALEQRKHSKYIYDLGGEWQQFTGLPFVFAAWVSNQKLSEEFISNFNRANEFGLNRIEEVVKTYDCLDFSLTSYYEDFINFGLNDSKRQGLNLFLSMLREKLSATPKN